MPTVFERISNVPLTIPTVPRTYFPARGADLRRTPPSAIYKATVLPLSQYLAVFRSVQLDSDFIVDY